LALELAIWGAMRGQFRDWKFLRFGHIIVGSSVAWGWMFYSVGVSLWNVAGILLATIITAPFIWRLIENYRRPPSDLASSESKIIPQRKVLPLGAKR
jgi:peptidoglycan/LPS O-acetylase OafA/YrhL